MDGDIERIIDRFHKVAMEAVAAERQSQVRIWGEQNHPDGTGSELAGKIADEWKMLCDANHKAGGDNWLTIAAEEFFEAAAEKDKARLLAEVVQNAAVFVAWAEDLIRQRDRGEW
jgi:hypothetical protein